MRTFFVSRKQLKKKKHRTAVSSLSPSFYTSRSLVIFAVRFLLSCILNFDGLFLFSFSSKKKNFNCGGNRNFIVLLVILGFIAECQSEDTLIFTFSSFVILNCWADEFVSWLLVSSRISVRWRLGFKTKHSRVSILIVGNTCSYLFCLIN